MAKIALFNGSTPSFLITILSTFAFIRVILDLLILSSFTISLILVTLAVKNASVFLM